MTRKILAHVPEDILQADLEKYRQRALELGATDALIIKADRITISEGVRLKCMVPACKRYDACANCPPHSPDLDFMRRVVAGFKYGILIKQDIPIVELTGPKAVASKPYLPYAQRNYRIVTTLESAAFSDGYYLAVGLGNGSCQSILCQDAICISLEPGKTCRFPTEARPSMDSVGIDVYRLVTDAGWDIYAIGQTMPSDDVHQGMLVGLVLVH